MSVQVYALLAILGGFIVLLYGMYRWGQKSQRTDIEADNAKIIQKQRDVVAPGNVHDATDRLRHLKS